MSKKLVFMGTPMLAVPILKSLYQNGYNISCVYTQPPQKSKRGQKINKSPIQGISETLNLEYRTPPVLNNEDEYIFLNSLDADLAIVVAYGQIIPKKFLSLTKTGFINIHASLLPKWRGAAPIQRSIIEGDQVSGVSFIKIDEGLDTGDIVLTDKIEIEKNDTQESLSTNLAKLGVKNLSKFLDLFNHKIDFVKQNNDFTCYANKILKSETRINWRETAELIDRKIRAFNPKPGAWFEMNGKRIKIFEVEISDGKGNPGEILNDEFEVACGKGSLKLKILQKEGKNKSAIKSFLLGNQTFIGSKLD